MTDSSPCPLAIWGRHPSWPTVKPLPTIAKATTRKWCDRTRDYVLHSPSAIVRVAIRERREAEGMCWSCGDAPPRQGLKSCQTCADARWAKENARRKRKRAELDANTISPEADAASMASILEG